MQYRWKIHECIIVNYYILSMKFMSENLWSNHRQGDAKDQKEEDTENYVEGELILIYLKKHLKKIFLHCYVYI